MHGEFAPTRWLMDVHRWAALALGASQVHELAHQRRLGRDLLFLSAAIVILLGSSSAKKLRCASKWRWMSSSGTPWLVTAHTSATQ